MMHHAKTAIWLVVFAAQHSAVTAGELTIECPRTITATESIGDLDDSWRVGQDSGKRGKFLDSMSIYTGDPAEMGNLIPDKTTRKNRKRTYTWEMSSQASEQHWVACTYTNSTLMLTKRLPESVRKCELIERLLPSGAKLAIETMRCEY